ncbi:allantoicase [Mycena olivaceomarginata]|nr:allantoicase [Mycena olivaceomarginata]
MAIRRVPLTAFAEEFSGFTELSSVALGGRVISVSDDFFAEAFHLLHPAPSLKGQFGPKGALCIIQLGTSGSVSGFDIDTSHFNGNEAPEVSVEVLSGLASEEPGKQDSRPWPESRHLFAIPETTGVNFVKLNMYPDGGIARFRVYGQVIPVHPEDPAEFFDLAPIKVVRPVRFEQIEIDTAHFKGNFPESCEVHALAISGHVDWSTSGEGHEWTVILPRTKLGPHRQHYFQLENVLGQRYTHVKVTIPSRRRNQADPRGRDKGRQYLQSRKRSWSKWELWKQFCLPQFRLRPAISHSHLSGRSSRRTGTTTRLRKGLKSRRPTRDPPASSTSYHCLLHRIQRRRGPPQGSPSTDARHPFTNQAFIPMGKGLGEGLVDPGSAYLVVVAKNGADGRPDVQTVRAFVANASQGIVYDTAVWHQPMTVLGKAMDLACVETQVGDGGLADCEIVELESAVRLKLPKEHHASSR